MQPLLQWKISKCNAFWEYVCSLSIQHAILMCQLSLNCPGVPYLSTLSPKWQDLRKKKLSNFKWMFWSSLQLCLKLHILGTVYHLVIYMQSNKIHNVVLMSKFYSELMLARHVSDLIGPSSGAFCTSCICRLWYVVLLCVLLDTSSRYKVLPTTL